MLNDAVHINSRPETAEDESFLRRLYASTREGEMALLTWNPEQKLAFLNLQFKLQRQQYRASFADAEFLVVLRENQPIGRFYLRRGAEYYQLIDISLLPEHRGGGVGTGLLVNLLAEAGTLAVPVRLHVTAHNRANKFYQRLGFVVREEQQIYLGMEWKP